MRRVRPFSICRHKSTPPATPPAHPPSSSMGLFISSLRRRRGGVAIPKDGGGAALAPAMTDRWRPVVGKTASTVRRHRGTQSSVNHNILHPYRYFCQTQDYCANLWLMGTYLLARFNKLSLVFLFVLTFLSQIELDLGNVHRVCHNIT